MSGGLRLRDLVTWARGRHLVQIGGGRQLGA